MTIPEFEYEHGEAVREKLEATRMTAEEYLRGLVDEDLGMDDSGQTGPITFENEIARRQLQAFGTVISFRQKRTTGKTWWTDKSPRDGGTKQGEVVVVELEHVEPIYENLFPYWQLSGFESAGDWARAIEELHDDPDEGYLYLVTTDEDGEESDTADATEPALAE